MKIIINHSSMVPIYEQIMEQIKAQVISGELKESDLLPYVMTRTVHGKGKYVTASNKELMLEERRREVEADLEAAVMKGRRNGMTDEELKELFELIMEE